MHLKRVAIKEENEVINNPFQSIYRESTAKNYSKFIKLRTEDYNEFVSKNVSPNYMGNQELNGEFQAFSITEVMLEESTKLEIEKSCLESFKTGVSVDINLNQINIDGFEDCSLCNARFSYVEQLKQHIREKHLGLTGEAEIQMSPQFNQLKADHFSTKGKIQNATSSVHDEEVMRLPCIRSINCEEIQLPCAPYKKYRSTPTVTTKRSEESSSKIQYRRKKSREKRFHCALCNYKTAQKTHLSYHIKSIHIKAKLFKCELCSYRGVHDRNLFKHVKSKHTDTKPYPCKLCGYGSVYKADLLKHVMSKHNEERPFECALCSYKGKRRGHLLSHIRNRHRKRIPISDVCIKASLH